MARPTRKKLKTVDTLRHHKSTRSNIPTAEFHSVMDDDEKAPVRIAYERRNRDLDPQLVWRGKDEQDAKDLTVQAPPLYIQEKVHPKVLIDDLVRQTKARRDDVASATPDLFADFNGLPNAEARTEFYRHDANWVNRMILGDSLQVMASLAGREGLRGKVQCIYFDPPYGIKFNSNFQWSTTSRDVRDGNATQITREPEQVKAFRDTWRDGIHSYLTYLRDRLTLARDLLAESGSAFVQIGDENVHRVRVLMDEIFGEGNLISEMTVEKTAGSSMQFIDNVCDYVLWYGRNRKYTKYRQLFLDKKRGKTGLKLYKFVEQDDTTRRPLTKEERSDGVDPNTIKAFSIDGLTSQTQARSTRYAAPFRGKSFESGVRQWATPIHGFKRLCKANRVELRAKSLGYVRFLQDYPVMPLRNIWTDTGTGSFTDPKVYVVQTGTKIVERCILMSTDPGDLVLDPTCGSGTAAYVAEQWGRRWITIDTSRVALALARARVMSARYPWYLLADSPEGQRKEGEINGRAPSEAPTANDIRQGFVYERVPHITLKSITNNAEIDVIWEKWQESLEPLRNRLNTTLGTKWEEWEIPREVRNDWPENTATVHAAWWEARIGRQKEIDASIAAQAGTEFLYDKPHEDSERIRVAGPFTVESVAPHRTLATDENDEPFSASGETGRYTGEAPDFTTTILETLKTAGVQQANKQDRIAFSSLAPWPGEYICAKGHYSEAKGKHEIERRAGIFVGPEFGTVTQPDLSAAAREVADAGFDVLIACGFNYDALAGDYGKLGRVPILKARMNADLHMAGELKNTGKGNLFVVFGEPDIEVLEANGDQIKVRLNGVDVFHPGTGEVRSDGPDDIACWFIDTNYNEESFFVRHAYFLGAGDPYKSLRSTLKAEIDAEAWSTLNSDVSRPFPRPTSGRIAVKVINHLGDEVMKVFRV